MKKLILPFFLFLSLMLNGQSFKKYVFLEHVTNSRCGICGSKNPGFYSVINNYPKDIVHISYHPSFPYSSCEFYKANPNENNSRVGFYTDVFGTPSVLMNGKLLASSSTLITDSQINTEKVLTSPVEINVTETGTTTRSFKVKINKTSNTVLPSGNYVFYAFMVEKLVPIATPNGEKEHHDVFRKAITPISGTDITSLITSSNSIDIPLSDYVIPSAYNEKEMYLIAFIQNASTKQILNVGTKFTTTTNTEIIVNPEEWFTTYPNPLKNNLTLELKDGVQIDEISILDMNGKQIISKNILEQKQLQIDFSPYSSGNYILKVKNGNKTAVQKITKVD